jgi:hypothetical protein
MTRTQQFPFSFPLDEYRLLLANRFASSPQMICHDGHVTLLLEVPKSMSHRASERKLSYEYVRDDSSSPKIVSMYHGMLLFHHPLSRLHHLYKQRLGLFPSALIPIDTRAPPDRSSPLIPKNRRFNTLCACVGSS